MNLHRGLKHSFFSFLHKSGLLHNETNNIEAFPQLLKVEVALCIVGLKDLVTLGHDPIYF